MLSSQLLSSVYGPVNSWRYGLSLGIDPIGEISTCSFNCVYCQLGEIEQKTQTRSIFVSTKKILQDLENYAYENADIITISGSGEPTLALNLGEILQEIKLLTNKSTLVLTNGSLLLLSAVRNDLQNADQVSVKLDGISDDQLSRINRPVTAINLKQILEGLTLFRQEYQGKLAIQTMILNAWTSEQQQEYIDKIKLIAPSEIQLNMPKRPKPLKHELDARGNHTNAELLPYPVQTLKCLSDLVLQKIGNRITEETQIPVRLPTT